MYGAANRRIISKLAGALSPKYGGLIKGVFFYAEILIFKKIINKLS
jgi:hypothetical protein